MLDVLDVVDRLDLAVGQPVACLGHGRHRQADDVDELVDGSAQNGAAVTLEILEIIGAAAEQADPQRGFHDDGH